MGKNTIFTNYLSTSYLGKNKPNLTKIDWIEYNYTKHFLGKDKTYLDIGPGLGETLVTWKKMGFDNISAIDISEEVTEHIKELGFNCTLVKDTIEYLNNNKNSYDFIMLNDVLEHIPMEIIYDLIDSIFGSLKKGGKLLIKVPNAQSPFSSIGLYADITHVQSFTEISLTQLLSYGGFQNMKFYGDTYPNNNKNPGFYLAKYIIMPIYFKWIRLIRGATFHMSPKILTQAITVVAVKK